MSPLLIAITTCLTLIILTIIYMNIETRFLKISKHTFNHKTGSTASKLTFIHFTDLHLGRTGIKTEKLTNTIFQNESDFLVFTGDYFERESEIPKLIQLMDEIRSNYTKPIYLCFGNHDNGDVFSKAPGTKEHVCTELEKRNITILENTSATYHTEDTKKQLRIIGLTDARSNKENIPDIIDKHCSTDPHIPNLLITHNSDLLMKMKSASVDFAVAGHTHGAQVRTPFNIETKLLHKKDFLSSTQNIIRGYHRYNNIDLYISRGIGCSMLPIRFISKPEIVIYNIIF